MTFAVDISIEKYKKLWADWIDLLEQHGTLNKENKNKLLLDPIKQEEFKAVSKFEIPEEVVKLYSIYNIDPNENEWAFTLDDEGGFDLLSFEGISKEWEEVDNLICDGENGILGDLDEDFVQTIDEEVDGKSCYARHEWIPIATDRQGNYLLIDLVPTAKGKKGQIVQVLNESCDRYLIADSLYDLIEERLNYLKSNLPSNIEQN